MDDEVAYSRIVEKILRTLWRILVNDPRACLVVFEEAQLVCPQERSSDVMRRVSLVKSIVTGGRKFGASFILGSQRPAELHKTPLSQCWIRLFGKTTERLDREVVEDYLKPFKSEALKNLRTGQFYVYGWSEQPLLVDVTSQRLTRHGGDTPLITQIQRSEKQQASIEEFRHRIEERLQQKKIEEEELGRLRTEKQDLEKRLTEAETRIMAMTQRLDELKDIRDMLTPLTEKLQTAQQSGVQVDGSILASLEELKIRMQTLERDAGEAAVQPILDQTTGLVKGDVRTQLILNKLNPEERMIFLALERRPSNTSGLVQQTGLPENRVRNLLECLRRKKAVRILGRRERKYMAVHGRGIFYVTVKFT
jgi:sugar-specific transcriptional regulator TrmB